MDQQVLDYLYGQMHAQKVRLDIFEQVNIPKKSCWNKSCDEKRILNAWIDSYKLLYKTQIAELVKKMEADKDRNVNSVFTYDTNYYQQNFIIMMGYVNNYLERLGKMKIDELLTTDLSSISKEVDELYPDVLLKPTLLQKL